MKKVCKHIGAVTVVITVLFALAITAYAASWRNSGKFSGLGYSGNYSAGIDLTENEASARLSISDYKGDVYLGGGATIRGYVYTGDEGRTLFGESSEELSCYVSFTNPAEGIGAKFTKIECEFSYMGFPVTDYTLNLN